MLRSVITVVVMSITGFLVGWRITSNWYEALAAYLLLLAFGFSMSWIGCLIGLSVSSPEVANTAGLAWLFPLTFVSNAFVPISSMPSWLQPFAAWNPVSSLVAAERQLFGSPVPITPATPFPERYAIAVSVGWTILILAIFVPLAIRKYRISGLK
jgi:ABC-type multidrug transport system permease subunit